jgi:hypothetical protein
MLVVLLTVVGLALLLMRRDRTERLDDHYSRMAAHLTDEVERRFESQRAVAETLAQAVPVLNAALAASRTRSAAEASAKHAEAAVALVDRMALVATEEAATRAGHPEGGAAEEAKKMQDRAANAKRVTLSAKDAAEAAVREAEVASTETARAASATEAARDARANGGGSAEAREAGQARRESANARERAAAAAQKAVTTAADADEALVATEIDAKQWLARNGIDGSDAVATAGPAAPRPTGAGAGAADGTAPATTGPAAPPKPMPPLAPGVKKALAELAAARAAVESAKRDLERTGGMPSHRKFGNDCLTASPNDLYVCFTRALLREVLHRPATWDIVACSGPRARAGGETFVLFPVTAAATEQLCLRVPISVAVEGADGEESASTGDRNFDEVVLVDRRDGSALFAEGRDPQARMSVLPGFDPKAMGASRRNADVEIGSTRYRMFLQPLAMTVPLLGPTAAAPSDASAAGKAGEESALLLAGLVREERFHTELYQVRPTAFLWAAAMVAIAVFCWPLAKLWLVGPRTRFGRFDAAFLVTAAVVATALSALLFPMLLAQASLGQRLDRQLSLVAERISQQLTDDVGAAARALDRFVAESEAYRRIVASADDKSKWPEIRAACERLGGETPQGAAGAASATSAGGAASPSAQLSEVTYRDDERRWPLCELVHAPSMLAKTSPSEGRELAFWVNREGLQQLKRVTSAYGTPAVAVTSRQYFQQALDGKARPLGAPAGEGLDAGKSLGVPEVVRSVTSTQKVLLVARPTVDEGKTTGVAAIEVRIGALRAPVMPKGFQMAVLQSDGTVMLHSKLDAHHGHSIFEDLGGRAGGELRALMASGTSGEIDARYRGTPSRLRAMLDPGTGWYVIVIASQGLLDVVVTDTSVSTLACVGIFALLLGAIAAMAAIARGSRAKLAGDALSGHVLSLRPHTRLAPIYAATGLRMLVVASALSFVTLVVGCYVPTTLLVVVALALALWASLSIPGFWRPVQIPARSANATWRDDLPTTYALACFGLANVFIIFPTIVFFVGAHCAAVGHLLRAEQDHYRAHLESRPACLAPAAANAAKDACPDVIWPPDMRRTPPAPRPENVAWFAEPTLWPAAVFTDRLPLYTSAKYDTALLSRAAPDATPPPPRAWVRSGSALHLQPITGAWALESDLPRLIGFDRWSWPIFVVLVFVALTAGANAVAYQTVQRLFFTDVLVERKAALAVKTRLSPDLLARELSQAKQARILLLHPPPDLAAKLRADPRVAALAEAASPCAPPKAVTFVADLEPLLGHSARTERLREAIATEPVLLVLSSVDPLRQGAPEQRRMWALTLKDFRVVNGPGRSPPSPPKLAHALIPGEQPSEAAFMHEWAVSDDDEQRVLAQLAIDGYASPHPRNAPTLRHLAARGLLEPDTLTLRDDDFRDFLRRTVSSDDLHAWQAAETTLAWRAVRVPLSAGVAILLALLGVSRPDLAETSALLPPIAAGLPVLLRVLASMASGRKTASA